MNADSSAPTTAATIAHIAATFAHDGRDVIGESPRQTGYHAPGSRASRRPSASRLFDVTLDATLNVPDVRNTRAVQSAVPRYPTAVSKPVFVPASYPAHPLKGV